MRLAVPSLTVLGAALVLLAPAAGADADGRADQPTFSLVTVTPDGEPSAGFSYEATLSGDGRHVVFTSSADDLTPAGVSPGGRDVVLRDLQRGVTRDLTPDADDTSRASDVSGDGSRVLFSSSARNLVRPGTDGQRHLYVWRRGAGLTQVDLTPSGAQPRRGETGRSALSANGRWVAFLSDSPGLVRRALGDGDHLYRRDLRTGRTTVLGARQGGIPAYPTISGDGRTVAFTSRLGGGQQNSNASLMVWRAGQPLENLTPHPDGSSYRPDLSRDGSTVAVETAASLDPADDHAAADVYVIDVGTGAATWLTDTEDDAESLQPTVSDQGRWVAFTSYAALTPDDTDGDAGNPQPDVYRYRRGWDGPQLVSAVDGGQADDSDASSVAPSISGDGSRLVFEGYRTSLVPGDGLDTGLVLADYGS